MSKTNSRVIKAGSELKVISVSQTGNYSYVSYAIQVTKEPNKKYSISCSRSASIEGSSYSAETTAITIAQFEEIIADYAEVSLSEPEVE